MPLDLQPKDRRTRRHENTKSEIVDAAWELAEVEGIGGFSLVELASAVGMRAPSLYQYFATKNDLYDAMYAGGYDELKARIGDLGQRGTLSREDIKNVGRQYFDFCTENPARYRLMCERPIPGFEPSASSAAKSEDVMRTQVRAVISSLGIEDEEMVRLFIAINAGVVSQQIATNPGGDEWRAIMDRAVDMFIDTTVGEPGRSLLD